MILGGADDFIRCPFLYDISTVHHQHPVGELLYQGNVMADK